MVVYCICRKACRNVRTGIEEADLQDCIKKNINDNGENVGENVGEIDIPPPEYNENPP